jgi:hypothetical protein
MDSFLLPPLPAPSVLVTDAAILALSAALLSAAMFYQGRLALVDRADYTVIKRLEHLTIHEAPDYIRCAKGLILRGYRSPQLGKNRRHDPQP